MKKLLPNLSKIPVWMSLSAIAISPLIYYALLIQPVNADPGEWLRSTINQAASSAGITPKSVPSQPAPIGNAQSDCLPPAPSYQASNPEPAPVRSQAGSYWRQDITPTDDRAKILLNLKEGTTRKAVNSRVGMGTPEMNPRYETSDGTFRVNYQAVGDRPSNDRVVSVEVIR